MPTPVINHGLSAIEQVVNRAASATGVDFGFLLRTAKRESGLNSGAHAPTSSAAGLFQFVEQTWMATLKRHGSAHGYARYAALIQQGADGRYSVPGGAEAKKAVMDLRYDPGAASTMAGELVSDHASYLRGRTGREPTGGELYAAHFLGVQGSARLIDAARSTPGAAAASLFPEAARANRNVFFKDGRPVSVAELYNNLGHSGGGSGGARGRVAADPGEGAFMQYAGAGRLERLREQEMLVRFFLSDGAEDSAPAKSLLSGEMLTALSSAKGEGQTR